MSNNLMRYTLWRTRDILKPVRPARCVRADKVGRLAACFADASLREGRFRRRDLFVSALVGSTPLAFLL